MDYGPIAVLLALIVAGIVWILTSKGKSSNQANHKHRRSTQSPVAGLSPVEFQSHWQSIEHTLSQPGLESTKAAIMEADKLVDIALRQKGFAGQTMGDRLKDARGFFGNNQVYQGLWQAHKSRNALAHELSFDMPKAVAQQHLQQFKAALQQLGML